MNQRYGAWAQLLTLFRLIYDGGQHGAFQIPPRKGYLFDPDRYPFLEGRADKNQEKCEIPHVADGILFKVLSNLLILDGERLSYRTLDVEQIGSVYETMMGFDLEVSTGRSIAIKPAKSHGAPSTINLEELLAAKPSDRTKWFAEKTDQKLTGQAADALKGAAGLDDLLAAMEKKIAKEVTPNVVPPRAMILQPSDERRRSASHYTPRILTEPIVRKTLEPILKRLGERPTPAQILALKICDPAMGSAAFLVETCRQLGDVLVKAWYMHNQVPRIPPDEDEVLHARRLIAQRCLYGVDKNAMAVDLAKLSLWLITLAKDHPFTFLDHALRCGDSLVGLTQKQIEEFHWKPSPQRVFGQKVIKERIQAATRVRQEILDASDDTPFLLKQQKLTVADESLNLVRLTGNVLVAAFFAADNDKKRQAQRDGLIEKMSAFLKGDMNARPTAEENALRTGRKGITPFHWEIEFPEVFGRENGGFDCFVGNPPFMGGTWISGNLGANYFEWLKAVYEGSGERADLVAYFFRRAFEFMRERGSFGLIATNTIAQGDTRQTGLTWICQRGGEVYCAHKRLRWPGLAAVVVSVVHVAKPAGSVFNFPRELDGNTVKRITAFLFHAGGDTAPGPLSMNRGKSFKGVDLYGMGFTFDDTITDGSTSPLSVMQKLIEQNRRNAERIFPYIGGEEINTDPRHAPHRYAINISDFDEEEARKQWPDLLKIVEEKVRPERMRTRDTADGKRLKANWWKYNRARPELRDATNGLSRVLVCSQVSTHHQFALLPTGIIFANYVVVFPFDSLAVFSVIQGRAHEVWVRFFASSMKDDIRYTPTDCFETFPFPESFETDAKLEAVGKEYYEFRAALMVKNNEGLTKTYNRFHDPNETSAEIKKLREMHAAMDQAVLDAYGWTELQPTCEFLLDYDEEEEEDAGDRPAGRGRKKPWRYRWPDEFRDLVLARLLELNKQRAEQEKLSGESTEKKEKKVSAKKGRAKKQQNNIPDMFSEQSEEIT